MLVHSGCSFGNAYIRWVNHVWSGHDSITHCTATMQINRSRFVSSKRSQVAPANLTVFNLERDQLEWTMRLGGEGKIGAILNSTNGVMMNRASSVNIGLIAPPFWCAIIIFASWGSCSYDEDGLFIRPALTKNPSRSPVLNLWNKFGVFCVPGLEIKKFGPKQKQINHSLVLKCTFNQRIKEFHSFPGSTE